jgi:hypothetical protein
MLGLAPGVEYNKHDQPACSICYRNFLSYIRRRLRRYTHADGGVAAIDMNHRHGKQHAIVRIYSAADFPPSSDFHGSVIEYS